MPRLKFLFGTFTFGILTIVVRLIYLQIFEHSKYTVLAQNQHFTEISEPSPRGKIYSSDGFLLAGNETRYLLYGEPKKIIDPTKTAELVVPIIRPDLFMSAPYLRDITTIKNLELNIEEALSRKDLYWVALIHGLSPSEKNQIEDLNNSGLGFREESSRFYPEGDLAREILGTVGQDKDGQSHGYFGIEGYYEGDLKGLGGSVFQEQNAFGEPILIGEYTEVPSKPGRDITLTINRSIQYLLEEKLSMGLIKYGAESVTGVIMNPQNGEILAMSSKFLGENSEASISGVPRNLAIASTYEPGSVIKPITVAAAIESSLVTPDTIYDDTGPVLYSTHLVDNWDRRHHGKITVTQVLELSNNCGAAWVGSKLGAYGLRDYLLKFGLGGPLGIDLEGETGGIINPASDWREIDTATASFGQGISATPLQVLNSYAVLANDGFLVRPHLVKVAESPKRRVISSTTATTLSQMLVSAVNKGEAKFYKMKNYLIAGKTGTAQIAVNGSYDPSKSNATFVGYFPGDPKFVMLVRLEKPSTSIYAAETAVPLWMSIASELALEMKIRPNR